MNFNSTLNSIKTYEAGKPIELVVREYGIDPKDIIKLASNENPYGTSPKVINILKQTSSNAYIYPDDSMYQLKEKLSNKFDLDESNIIIGAGSDQIIEFCIHAKCNKDSKILISNTTFAMYEIYAKQVGASILKTKDDQHNLDQFKELYKKENPDIIFLCLPNNPLGECLDARDVYDFLDTIDKDTLVVLDGAYQEYAKYKDNKKAIDVKMVIKKYSNVIYLGTFSKAYALGGLRVGYGISNTQIISTLHKLRPPFNITTLSLAAAIEAIDDQEFVDSCIEKNFIQMKEYEKFAKENNLTFIPSYTNFITVYMDGYNSKEVSQKLLEKGIIVRDMSSYGFNAIRITIGRDDQNNIVFKNLKEILKK